MKSLGVTFFVLASLLQLRPSSAQAPIELSIIHINDFHARFEPVNVDTAGCPPGDNEQVNATLRDVAPVIAGLCFGGISRVVTALRDLQQSMPNPILLNGGDSFQGTLLYTLFKWNITMEFMNRIPFDATAIGNHEFDDGVAGAVPYMEGLNNPIVAANMDASLEPTVQGKFQSSVVVERAGKQIGIIGCTSKYNSELSSSGDLIFLDEVETVSAEAARLRAQGVDILVLVSHSGYDVDQRIAVEVPDLDIIVGAHSHSFLYTGTPPSIEVASGEYPTVVTQTSGRRVLVVQAYAYTKYVGALSVQFDAQGEVVSWSGNPVLLDSSVEEDPVIKSDLQPWVDEANVIGDKIIGTSAVLLESSNCYGGECGLGSFLTDAMVAEQVRLDLTDAWTLAAIAFINPGGLRAPLGVTPNITFNDLTTSQPFSDSIDVLELLGKDIVEILEMSASRPPGSILVDEKQFRENARDFQDGKGCMQVSGIQAEYKMSNPHGSRLVDVQVRCAKCRVPVYEPVKMEEWYAVAMPSFLSNGGSGFDIIPERSRNKVIGLMNVDVFSKYITNISPITQGIDRRIRLID